LIPRSGAIATWRAIRAGIVGLSTLNRGPTLLHRGGGLAEDIAAALRFEGVVVAA
jgi:hypothetical protein